MFERFHFDLAAVIIIYYHERWFSVAKFNNSFSKKFGVSMSSMKLSTSPFQFETSVSLSVQLKEEQTNKPPPQDYLLRLNSEL